MKDRDQVGPKEADGHDLSRRSLIVGAGAATLMAGMGTILAGCSNESPSTAATAEASSESSMTTTEEGAPWYGEAADISTFDFVEEVTCEILICGAGHGGMVASLAAAEQGADTLVIEKNSKYNVIREYIGAVGASCQKAAGSEVDPLDVTKELMRYASYRADQKIIKLWADESGETVDWLMGHLEPEGFGIVAETDVAGGYHDIYPVYPTHTHIQLPEGKAVCDYVVSAAEAFGAQYRFDTALVQCILEDGAVTGVVAEGPDGHIKITASKGVLLATGGYEGDDALIERLQPSAASLIAFSTALPQNVGEGIRAGIWAGGRKDESTAIMLFDRGALLPTGESGLPVKEGNLFWMGSQPWLKVNLEGNRFCNETAPYDFPIHAVGLRRGKTWCSIWDSNWQENVSEFHTIGCSRIEKSPTEGMTQNFLFPSIEGMNEGLMEAGFIQQADTIEELANKLDIPADNLKATVDRYNELAAAGRDEDFGKPAKDVIALDNPPYYGVRQGAFLLCTIDGLRINTDCAVIDDNDEAIPGLWAAGNVTGGFFANNYPELVVGCACGRTMTEARHAVLNMLGMK